MIVRDQDLPRVPDVALSGENPTVPSLALGQGAHLVAGNMQLNAVLEIEPVQPLPPQIYVQLKILQKTKKIISVLYLLM